MEKQVVLEIEISREQIPLRNAYKHIGQKASIRVNSGVDTVLPGDTTCANGHFPTPPEPCFPQWDHDKEHARQIVCTAAK